MDSFKSEEKVLENDHQDSLEQDILLFFGGISYDSDRPIFDEWGAHDDDDIQSQEDYSGISRDRSKYWESQQLILQEILSHGNLTGSKLRSEVKQAFEQTRDYTCSCNYNKPTIDWCATCLRRAVVNKLCDNKFNAALCTSKWNSTRKVPGGTHEYIDVITHGRGRKKETRYLVELEFRAEFELAKACIEYQNLISMLPEIYIGKPEHLNSIVRIMCNAAKRSMKEKKIYIGPWRKKNFMEMKWLTSTYQRYPYSDQRL